MCSDCAGGGWEPYVYLANFLLDMLFGVSLNFTLALLRTQYGHLDIASFYTRLFCT